MMDCNFNTLTVVISFALYWIVTGEEADRKWGRRDGNDMQQKGRRLESNRRRLRPSNCVESAVTTWLLR